MALSLVFMGTPPFAVPTLQAVRGAGHRILAVYTQPPRPAGRGLAEQPGAVAAAAAAMGLPVRHPARLRAETEQEALRELGADVGVVVAYGLLLPAPVLSATRHGFLNLHPSRLPRWRGAAPIQRTIMAGDRETAAAIMRMDEGLDTGPVCLSEPLAVPDHMTAGELHDLLAMTGARLMVDALDRLEHGRLECRAQSAEGVTYAAKIGKGEARIDWRLPAATVHDHIRGLSPFPGAWLEVTVGGRMERLKVLRTLPATGDGRPGEILGSDLTIACGSGAVRLLTVQRAGKRAMSAEELLRGLALPVGTVLPSPD